MYGFKPCYKWNTFNTSSNLLVLLYLSVLNLVISGIPSIPGIHEDLVRGLGVLNLVISGIPSIRTRRNHR